MYRGAGGPGVASSPHYCRSTTCSLAGRASPLPLSHSIYRGSEGPHQYGDKLRVFNVPERPCRIGNIGPDAYALCTTYGQGSRAPPACCGSGLPHACGRPSTCVADTTSAPPAGGRSHALFGPSMGHPPSPSTLPARRRRVPQIIHYAGVRTLGPRTGGRWQRWSRAVQTFLAAIVLVLVARPLFVRIDLSEARTH